MVVTEVLTEQLGVGALADSGSAEEEEEFLLGGGEGVQHLGGHSHHEGEIYILLTSTHHQLYLHRVQGNYIDRAHGWKDGHIFYGIEPKYRWIWIVLSIKAAGLLLKSPLHLLFPPALPFLILPLARSTSPRFVPLFLAVNGTISSE